ncbi:MAG: hypothetical protein MI749_03635 [Desulfovibrionales bacterium]|nr:hypothetical protein [Desulfovibrionales bacterium]
MRAFTLLEFTIILGIICILTLLALPKLAPNAQKVSGAADILRTHLRYAQIRAQAYGILLGLQNKSNIGYVFFEETPDTHTPLPGCPSPYTLKNSITISNFLVSFNASGTPCSDHAATKPIQQDVIITLRDGMETETVRIVAATGFVV